ncbi:MAG: permease [Candidatus Hodarchaeales archaeon]|jgi:uncharacterized membrane protein YraQ (UPF0718 family)
MVNIVPIAIGALESALLTLVDYLSLHVLLCLIPAFFIAGAMVVFIPKDVIMKYMGKNADPKVAYPMATAAGFLLAVCSCTVLPLFVGIWKKGVGLGPAITFLFVAPAINILALTYTGTLIGMDIAVARAILAIVFAVSIGIIMAKVFGNESSLATTPNSEVDSEVLSDEQSSTKIHVTTIILIIIFGILSVLLAVLDAFMIDLIVESFFSSVSVLVFFAENPSIIQTLIFVLGFVILVILTSKIKNREIVLFLWLIYILMTGTSQIAYFSSNIQISGIEIDPSISNMLAKLIFSVIVIIGLVRFTRQEFNSEELDSWFTETWFFVKSIFPLVITGVVIAGFIKYFVPPDLIADIVGRNTVVANLTGVLFGVFMYFPTLMEVPIAKIFLELGMARGPLLAYLLADPELSIQSILVTRKYLGDKRNSVFVLLVTIFTTIAGLLFGLLIGQGIELW